MLRYINFVINRPKTTISIIIIITIFLLMGLPKLKFDSSIDVMMPQEDRDYIYNQEIKKIFGNNDDYIIINTSDKKIWSPLFIEKLNNLIIDLEEYQNFDQDKEKLRLEIIDKYIKSKSIDYQELLFLFKNDFSFKRAIKRYLNPEKKQFKTDDFINLQSHLKYIYTLKKSKRIKDIVSPLTGKDISGEDDTLSAIDLVEIDDTGKRILPDTEKSLNKLKRKLLKNPNFEKGLYSKNKNNNITDFAIFIRLSNDKKHDKVVKEIWNISTSHKDFSVTPQGTPIVNKFMSDFMKNDMATFIPLVLLIVVITFFFNFKSIRGMALPFFCLLIGDFWTIGLMGHLGLKVTMIGVSLPSIIVAVGSSYSIHVLNQYYIDFDKISDNGKLKGLRSSMGHISITVLLAGITTLIGFASLLTNQVSAVREWGFLSAMGVIFSVILSTSLIPACLMLLSHNDRRSDERSELIPMKKRWIDSFIDLIVKASNDHYKIVISCTVLFILIAIAGIFKIHVNTSLLSYFKEDSYIRKSSLLIGEKYGGLMGMGIVIDSGEANGVKDPIFLNNIDKMRKWMELDSNKDLNIGRTDAFPDIIKTMHRAMNNDNLKYYAIPDDKLTITEYLDVFSGDDEDFDGRADDFETYIDPDYQKAYIFARIWEKEGHVLNTNDYSFIKEKISIYLKNNLPKNYKFRITGIPITIIKLSNYIVRGQIFSLIFCILLVGFIVILLFKNINAGILALIPMSVAVLVNFGLMGWFNIDLDLATSMIAAVAIGIGVDDTIHFLNTYRHYRSRGFSTSHTIHKTLVISGKAIIFTSIALIFGFSVLMLSNFKPIILFGMLVAITMIATTLGALLVLPAAIRLWGVNLKESNSNSLFWRIFYIGKFFNIDE